MPTPLEVWVVEDNDLLRDSYLGVLSEAGMVDRARAFPACEPALDALRAGEAPDIVFMDIGLPGMSGIEGARTIRAVSPGTRVVMLTVHEDRENVFQALCAGATGYVLKPSSESQVVETVREIDAGGVPMSAEIARKVLEIFRRWEAPARDYGLTPREVEVLQLLVDGRSQKRIAADLSISQHTVNSHIRNIYAKLHVHSRSRVVAKALKERLI